MNAERPTDPNRTADPQPQAGHARCGDWPVGVCSWSLRADVDAVARAMRQLRIGHVNLGLRPMFAEGGDAYLDAVRRQAWTISATTLGFPQEDYSSIERIRATGGIVPDECWPENLRRFERAVSVTAGLGTRLLTMHAGFLESDEAARAGRIRDRLARLADVAAGGGISLLLETGQETPEYLADLLEKLEHPALGVNLDPANLILYDKGDPVEAVRILGRWIRHVHVKDAVRTLRPGTWGTEVPWDQGEVGAASFLNALRETGFTGTLAIEREAGEERLRDVRTTVGRLLAWTGTTPAQAPRPGEIAP